MIGNILRQRYRIIKKLGAGGFGETYLAEDLDIPVSPKPICVVKKLHPTIIDPEIIRLFEQEAQILYKLGQNHDQIPKLSGYFQEDKDFYLIQEFIDGYDLTQEISPGKKLSEDDVIQLLRDVLEILVYVHENKVIHRDIKPANIMRRKDGKLLLIDFGVVKQINTTIAMKSGLTSRTISIGTHGYMSPEQGFGKPKLSSDIYALGMTAIEALISFPLNRLSEDEDTGEIIWNNLAQVSDKLEQFITKMVRYDWRQRYRDAKEALDQLNKVFVANQISSLIPKLVPVKLNGKYGYVCGGKLVTPCQFDDVSYWFFEGLAAVKMGDKWGYINTTGQIVIPCQFDYAGWFSEGLAWVSKDDKYGYINTTGQIVIPCQCPSEWSYDDEGIGRSFCDGLAPVEIDSKWGYVNTTGQIVIPYQFDYADSFSEGIARVNLNNKWGYIDTSGQIIIHYQFDWAYSFQKGIAPVQIDKKWGYIDTSGQIVVPYQFDWAYSFEEGISSVKMNEKYGCINTRGQLVIPCEFDKVFRDYWRDYDFEKGMMIVKIGDKWGYINTSGSIVIPCQFDSNGWFCEGLAGVKMGDKWGYINTTGQIVIPCQFDSDGKFSEGLAGVKMGDKWGYINKRGLVVIPYQFDAAYSFGEGLAKVTINGKEHLIDKIGNIVY
jgi:serine/threonine-protein kinase